MGSPDDILCKTNAAMAHFKVGTEDPASGQWEGKEGKNRGR